MTDNLETFCRYQDTDESRAFREAIEERAETQAPEEVSHAVNLIRDELKELRRSWAVGNPGSGMMKHS
jgi:hypothetical protein